MSLTGTLLQVYITIGGVTKGVDQNGSLTAGSGFQFGSPHDAAAALTIAIDSNTGHMTSFKCVQTPG